MSLESATREAPLSRPFKHPLKGILQHRCEECKDLLEMSTSIRCKGCALVRYCSTEHERRHSKAHNLDCTSVQAQTIKVGNELEKLSRFVAAEEDPLQAWTGHFWQMEETQEYCLARKELLILTHHIGTLDAVEAELEELHQMLRLDRSDPLHIRLQMPALMLQLGRDQECYDFVKWWETRAHKMPTHQWTNINFPYLNVIEADVLKSITWLDKKRTPLAFLLSVLVLRIKLAIDVNNIAIVRRLLSPRMPKELVDLTSAHVVQSPIALRFIKCNDHGLHDVKRVFCGHIRQLGRICHEKSPLVTQALLHPTQFINSPELYVFKSAFLTKAYSMPHEIVLDEVMGAFHMNYPAMYETEGVLDLITLARRIVQLEQPGSELHRLWERIDVALDQSSGRFGMKEHFDRLLRQGTEMKNL